MDWAKLLNLSKFEEKKNYRSHFGRERREKSREISVKFENLEKKMI